ncbi:MAG: hypothetical protein OEM82_07100 [Acidobacteriota bacterium]|nr:hypothetical protein [Acidobacteriota bacterium]MDH3528731.1 hypothetical protein [Acidobacteriota bacterium]
MNTGNNTGISKTAMLFTGLITFVVGLIFAAAFSSFFNSRLVPFAVMIAALVFVVYRFKSGNCCGR